MKDFDLWNNLKKKINERIKAPFANQRDIWWCSIGVNVGTEEDGKNEIFERPGLVISVINKDTIRIAPLTSKIKNDKHNIAISYGETKGSVILSQVKTISTKRLSRKMTRLDKTQFEKVIEKFKECL